MYIPSNTHFRLVRALRGARRVGFKSDGLRALQIALATERRTVRGRLTPEQAQAYTADLLDKYLPY